MSEAVPLYLASSSPRRHMLMRLAGYSFTPVVVHVDETPRAGENPEALVLRLSQEKARCGQEQGKAVGLVVAADTLVVDNKGVLGKPAGVVVASEMLWRLRGKIHKVITGLTVLNLATGQEDSQVIITLVSMHSYSAADIAAYITSGSPLDKAGAYGIQDQIHPIVAGIFGCYANVMGLPVCFLATILARYGLLPNPTGPLSRCSSSQSNCGFGMPQVRK